MPTVAIFAPNLRDNENAYVSVNGKTCWQKNSIVLSKGEAVCGGGYKSEERFPVSCQVTLSGTGNRPLAVRVWTTLNQGANDESFAIDNVVIRKLKTPGSFHFDNTACQDYVNYIIVSCCLLQHRECC